MENELKNSVQYINNKVGKKTGFSAPTNYFDNLQDSIQAKIAEESFSKKSAFKVPENYFEDLENNVLGRISSEVKETKVISFKERVFKLIPIAAAASIILFIGLNSMDLMKGFDFNIILAIVVGMFLHISTTIIFETSENHKFNFLKLITIFVGCSIAFLMH